MPLLIDSSSLTIARHYLMQGKHSHSPEFVSLQATMDFIEQNEHMKVVSTFGDTNKNKTVTPESDRTTRNVSGGELQEQRQENDVGEDRNGHEIHIAQPAARIFLEDEEEFPQIIRLQVVLRIAFALMLFGRDYDISVLGTGIILRCDINIYCM